MAVIENFAELSEKEQREFAEALIKTINSEHTFTAEDDFKITGVDVYETTGDLVIQVTHDNLIDVEREATWQANDADDAHSSPEDPEYENSIFDDAEHAFKVLVAEIGDYKVSLDIDDVDEEETSDVDVSDISYEDSGIGSYEYWGDVGYDSRPYVEVTGTITKACSFAIILWVEPKDTVVEPEAEEEI